MINDYVRVRGTHQSILDFSDLMGVALRGDDVQGFDTRWDDVLTSLKEMPQDHTVKSLLRKRRI